MLKPLDLQEWSQRDRGHAGTCDPYLNRYDEAGSDFYKQEINDESQ
ncbi:MULTISPECIES: hypothetical protein [Burkholderia cepacia complex]|uniref:Uncharacterized protein n=1 Tax=Burkholderia pyrrocinia TaxID=60550 RepID=A0ABZ3BN46_BURPY|nr:hypothetical protein [Burkholderia stabilis]